MRRVGLLVVLGILALSLVGCILIHPKTAKVHGIVTNESKEPIAGLIVRLGSSLTVTSENGTFVFHSVTFGTYDLRVEGDASVLYEERINVKNDEVYVEITVEDVTVPVSYVSNFSFEDIDSSTGFARDWKTRTDEGDMEFAIDTMVARTGDASLRLTGMGSDGRNRGPAYQRAVAPEGTYRFTAWYKTYGLSAEDVIRARIRFFDSANKEITGLSEDPQFTVLSSHIKHWLEGDKNLYVYGDISEDAWDKVEMDFVTPVGTARILVELFLWHDVGTVWWDDIYLVKLD